MTPSLTKFSHIHRALAARSPEWADSHRLRRKGGVLLFQVGHGIITRTVFAVHESESRLVIVSGLSARPVAESTLLAWFADPEGMRNFA